ncbi:hypothetical protein HXX76_013701 [Chlamydomonas incerta]|uniref:Sulfatase N-terminal domain-containing protein n=1 Tax=Chlamydomonas incerta TaxID=51695 RepID=A0A835SIE0_CHLIN|nr:hypothetical protein HXX76_013701 [Chlamydomonas incerta]|eukprot:KAG2425492.1 hypothetical protein HXX76_013701 [Chlamydomonas incerta]
MAVTKLGWHILALGAILLAACRCGHATGATKRPNIVLIMTDDQDYMLNSTHPYYMPQLHRLVRRRGLEVQHFITPVASCCPARTAFLTGRHCHNTNMTSNAWPLGGYIKFKRDRLDQDYLPVWLQAAGYNTYLVGKLLNGFTQDSAARMGCPRGWTSMDPLAKGDAGPSEELSAKGSPTFLRRCDPSQLQVYPGAYEDVVIRDKTLEYIDEAAAAGAPFFLFVPTFAPHDQYAGGSAALPEVEPKYRGLFANVQLPKSPNFARQVPGQVGYYWTSSVKDQVADITTRYRARLESLRTVDDMIAAAVGRLACRGLLQDTVLMFTSDNGYKLGNHNIAQEKFTQYEEDVRVPLLMAGPGVPRGAATGPELQASLVDLTATILALAGASTGAAEIDGAALPLADLLAPGAAAAAAPAAGGGSVPPDSDVSYYCTPPPPPDPPLPPAPPAPPAGSGPAPAKPSGGDRRRSAQSRAADTAAQTSGEELRSVQLGVQGEAGGAAAVAVATDLQLVGAADAPDADVRPAAEAATAAAAGPVGTDGLAGWQRPAGWTWRHEMWIQDHAAGLGLTQWLLDQQLPQPLRPNLTAPQQAQRQRQAQQQQPEQQQQQQHGLPAVQIESGDRQGGGLPAVDPARLVEYSLERVRAALREVEAEQQAEQLAELQEAEAQQDTGAEDEAAAWEEGFERAADEEEGAAAVSSGRRRSVQQQQRPPRPSRPPRPAKSKAGKPPSPPQPPPWLAQPPRRPPSPRPPRPLLTPSTAPVTAPSFGAWSNAALIESWLDGVFKGKSYRTLRICADLLAFGPPADGGAWTCYKYTKMCNPVKKQAAVPTQIELYDLGQDPAEVRDRSRPPYSAMTQRLLARLDAVLTVLSYCSGDTCRQPFSRIHPDGAVVNLTAAMDAKYDSLYGSFKPLTYRRCAIYYDPANELPDPFLAGLDGVGDSSHGSSR